MQIARMRLVPILGGLLLAAYGCSSPSSPAPPTSIAVSPPNYALAGAQTVQFKAIAAEAAMDTTNSAVTTAVTWSATSGTIDAGGNYTAPSGAASTIATITAHSTVDPTKSGSATVHVVAPGVVVATANSQVAQYSIAPAATGTVSVEFGPDTNYGRTTWTQPGTASGAVNLLVAGMTANTLYHMRAVVLYGDGAKFVDADQTFTTGSLPAQLLSITATTTPGKSPQSGVELLDSADFSTALATDLGGNVIWSYNSPLSGVIANPVKLLPNGHFLMNFSGSTDDGENSVIQEVDLAGSLIWQLSAGDLNAALSAAKCAGCNITIVGTHHDFAVLPTGHVIVIAATQQDVDGVTVTGDVLIDLDENHQPVWLWNEFDHLDVYRRPMNFPDWTHTNALLYSPDDGNLIVSVRHQNWLVKVDYANGTGAGDILWKLGVQGDFQLVGGTDPTDWFYAQHGPSFASTNTAGVFALAVFDNGNDRVFPPGVVCNTAGAPPCFYSTAKVLQIDETAKTASLTFNNLGFYSFFGGNAGMLQNGDVEYCEANATPGPAGDVYEVTQDSSAQTIWKMQVTGSRIYRGQRIPSLYPGVQW